MYAMIPVSLRAPGGETCTQGGLQCFRERGGGGVGLCRCEEALNGDSWHQRSQLTTRTITYWTKTNDETTQNFMRWDSEHLIQFMSSSVFKRQTKYVYFFFFTVVVTNISGNPSLC